LTVGEIRDEIWKRQDGLCLRCGDYVTKATAHLHEVISRGKGGEVSLDNSIILCSACHIGVRGVHGNRRPQWSKHE
jgi:5-methylcytosine-specific restriction endonuclease McrA